MFARITAFVGLVLVLASSAIAGPILDRNGVPLDENGDTPVQYIRPETLKTLVDRQLSFDAKISEVVREEIAIGVRHFKAKRGAGLVMDVHTGEILGMATYEGSEVNPVNGSGAKFDMLSQATFELGLNAKAITIASALEAGVIKPDTLIDARKPIKLGQYTVEDFEPSRKQLKPDEVMVRSSNIAIVRAQMALGSENTRLAFHKAGQFSRLDVDGFEVAGPLVQSSWNELTAVTVAYGHGFAVTPLHAAAVMASFGNGGILVKPTIFKVSQQPIEGKRLWSQNTADFMLAAMRRNVVEGTGTKINFPQVQVAGLTGTSSMIVDGKYSDKDVITTFAGIFPADHPKYLVFTVLDRPQALKETYGFQTSGWNAAPVAGEIIKRIN